MRACKVKLSPLNAISCDSLGAEGSNESGVEYSQIVQGGGGSGGGVGVKALSWLPALVQGKQSVYIAPVELSLTASSAVRRLIQVRQDIETKQNFLSTLIGRVFVDPIICFVFKCTRSELVAFSWGVKRSSCRDSTWVGWDTMLAIGEAGSNSRDNQQMFILGKNPRCSPSCCIRLSLVCKRAGVHLPGIRVVGLLDVCLLHSRPRIQRHGRSDTQRE